MSSSIWTRCAGDSEIRPLEAAPVRVVEAQHRNATRKLVDSDEEQGLLEALIDAGKPPPPADAPKGLHYLLFTPFRYPPLRHGSRFGRRTQRSPWYGSDAVETALAEVAYYRLVFLEGSEADLAPLEVDLTAFRATVRTGRGVDLSAPPFDAHRAVIASPVSYEATQALGEAMRASGVEVFRYPSARDPDGGTNLGLLVPRVFVSRRPRDLHTWRCTATREAVEFSRRDWFRSEARRLERAVFEVAGELPAPAP